MATVVFTNRGLSALKPTAKRYEVRDPDTAGLFLRVGTSGAKSWWMTYNRVRKQIGTFQSAPGGTITTTVDQARDEYKLRVVKMGAAGETAKREATVCKLTLNEAWDLYHAANPASCVPRTMSQRTYMWRQHYASGLGKQKLTAITQRDIKALRKVLVDKHYAGSHINKILTCVRLAYKYAIDEELLPFGFTPPTQGVKRVKPAKGRRRHLMASEFQPFFDALDRMAFAKHEKLTSGYFRTVADAFRMMLFTGARSANVKTMRWQDISLTRRVWTVPREFKCPCGLYHGTKTEEVYEIPLTSQAVEILKRRIEGKSGEGDFVFPGRGEALHLGELKHVWTSVLAQSGLEGLTIHDLRRTQGSLQAQQGVNLALVGEALCHADITSTGVYAHSSGLDQVRENMERANRAMTTAGGDDVLVLSQEEWDEIVDALEAVGSPLVAKVRGVADAQRMA